MFFLIVSLGVLLFGHFVNIRPFEKMHKINTLAYFVSMSVTKKSGVSVLKLMLKQNKLEGL